MVLVVAAAVVIILNNSTNEEQIFPEPYPTGQRELGPRDAWSKEFCDKPFFIESVAPYPSENGQIENPLVDRLLVRFIGKIPHPCRAFMFTHEFLCGEGVTEEIVKVHSGEHFAFSYRGHRKVIGILPKTFI